MSHNTVLSKLTLAEEGGGFHAPPPLKPPRPDLHKFKSLTDTDIDDNSKDDDLSMSDDDLSLASTS